MPRPSVNAILRDAARQAIALGMPRCRFITAAISLVNQGPIAYADEATRDQYVQELYLTLIDFDGGAPTDQQVQQAYGMASQQSTCGITTERIWREAGVDDPNVFTFYFTRVGRGNYAVMEEKQFAESLTSGAWVSGIPWVEGSPLPQPGDAVIIGLSSDASFTRGGGFSGEHEFNVVSTLDDYVHSVDGGQPGIAVVTRAWSEVWTGTDDLGRRTGELWACKVGPDGEVALGSDGRPVQGRRVVGYTDVSKLPLRPGSETCLPIPALPAPDPEDADYGEPVPTGTPGQGGAAGHRGWKILFGVVLLGAAAGAAALGVKEYRKRKALAR